MNSIYIFIKKEWLETIRSGKFTILVILFILFGIMNPAIAMLTPWMLEILSDSLAESGMRVTGISVDALTSWTQFFKNIPIACIMFTLIYSTTLTKEYHEGTLILTLTKGLPRHSVILAKSAVMLMMWSICYLLCFTITYIYNAYFWDNRAAYHLIPAAAHWWLLGVWITSLIILFSVLFNDNSGVLLSIGASVIVSYLMGFFPNLREYTPTMLLDSSLIYGTIEPSTYLKAVVITAILCVTAIIVCIPVFNNKRL